MLSLQKSNQTGFVALDDGIRNQLFCEECVLPYLMIEKLGI
jgi:hypothetical protein